MSEPFNPFAAPEVPGNVQTMPSGNFEELAGVERGLRLVYLGLCGIILSLMGSVAVAILAPAMFVIPAATLFISWLMVIIGPFFCLSAPAESRAKGLIVSSVLCQVAGLFAAVAQQLRLDVPQPVLAISQLLAGIGSVLFVFFLMKVAVYIGRDDLRRKGAYVLIGGLGLFVLTVACLVSMLQVRGDGLLGLIILIGLGGLILFLMYANLISYLSRAIAELRARPSERSF